MAKDYVAILEGSKSLDPKVFSLVRIKILHSLFQVYPDGITFREFSSGLGVQDGLLLQNLRTLGEVGYVRSERIETSGKNLEAFFLTRIGYDVWSESRSWLLGFLEGEAV